MDFGTGLMALIALGGGGRRIFLIGVSRLIANITIKNALPSIGQKEDGTAIRVTNLSNLSAKFQV